RLADIAAVINDGRLHAAVDLAGERVERPQRAGAGEVDDGLHERTERRAAIQGASDGALVGWLRPRRGGDVVAGGGQEYIGGVVAQRRRQEGEVAGDARERAGDAAVRGQDGVSRLPRIGLVLRQHLYRPAGERSGASRDDLVRLPGGIGLDLVKRARQKVHIAVDGERADRVAGRDRGAGPDDESADEAVAHQRAASIDKDGRNERAVHIEYAGIDVGGARVGVGAR